METNYFDIKYEAPQNQSSDREMVRLEKALDRLKIRMILMETERLLSQPTPPKPWGFP